MSSVDERNNTMDASVDMKSLNTMHPELLPPLPFLTATSILGGQSLENNRDQAEIKQAAGTSKRVEGLDIDNPLYNYTENCNRPEKMVNIEREKCGLPLPEKKTEEEDVYV